MRHNKCVYGIFLICFLLVACVSKDSYEELAATLADTRTELEQKSSQIKELKSKLKHFEEELRQSEENRKQLQLDLSALRAQTRELENTNLQLAQRLTGLGIVRSPVYDGFALSDRKCRHRTRTLCGLRL
jgi:septal ring factor EnvC (AmiA/AmiB activator)